MSISASLLPEFDQEMANTRKMIERVPKEKFGWKPHEKSLTLGQLASHLVNIPTWGVFTMKDTSFDVAPVDREPMTTPEGKSATELLKMLDKNVADARKAIAEAKDADYMVDWSLLGGGKVYFTLPRIAVIRSFLMNHMIHHRAQLGVYLRLLDVPVPGMYGPSADEQ